MIYDKNNNEYLTAYDLAKKMDLHLQTIYKRFQYKTAKDRWKVQVVKDSKTGKHKYAVSRKDFEEVWVGSDKQKLTENQKRLLSKTP